MPERVDFSRNAPVYDQRHGGFISREVADRLAGFAGLRPESQVLDVGVGTGRVAIPLANRCHVTGVDVALPMLAALRQKADIVGARLPVSVADAMQLPFINAQFDAVILARLLYLLPSWRNTLFEVLRVLKPDGYVLHEWGNGKSDEEWVQIREQARVLFENAGVSNPFHPGVRSDTDVNDFFICNGMPLVGQLEFAPDVRMTVRDFLERLERGECSYTWNLPADVQQTCVPQLVDWARSRFDTTRLIESPMVWKIYHRTELD